MKYLHVVYKITDAMKRGLSEVPRRGGMYNWMFLFKGTINQWYDIPSKEELEQYDVIQINLAPTDQLLAGEIRRVLGNNSSTLLIGNNDYVTEYWDQFKTHPLHYLQAQEYCDAVFGTEEYQSSQMIETAYTIPHPHWIKMLKKIGNDDLDMTRFKIGVLYHWWEGKTYEKFSVLHKLRKRFPKLFTRLYAYGQPAMDRSLPWQKSQFDKIMPTMDYPDYIRSLQTNRFIYENCAWHTYGRTSVDTAALRIPTLGSDRVFSMKHCWPNMVSDPFDARRQIKIMEKVLTQPDWLYEQLDYAHEACEFFNYENSKKRYLHMVEDTRRRLSK